MSDWKKEIEKCKEWNDGIIDMLIKWGKIMKPFINETGDFYLAFVYGVILGDKAKDKVEAMEGKKWPERSAFELGKFAGPITRQWIMNEIMPFVMDAGEAFLKQAVKNLFNR